MRRGLSIVAALILPLVLTPAASAAKRQWSDYERPAEFSVVTDHGVEIPMRDGVVLQANVQRPDVEGRCSHVPGEVPVPRTSTVTTT
jgi:predicted acyl esterase